MSKEYSFRECADLTGDLREYMIYFVGLTEDTDEMVKLQSLEQEMPYESREIVGDLEKMEGAGFVERRREGLDIYPVETEGFNDVLQETQYSELDATEYGLGEKGREYLESSELYMISDELRDTFDA